MSDKRTMTAAQLLADTDEARDIWSRRARGELSVTHMDQDAMVNVYGPVLHDGKWCFDTEYEDVYDTYSLPPDEPVFVEPTRLGTALDALRFYADEATYRASNGVTDAFSGRGTSAIEEDSGERARVALGEVTR
jgi:hypothetical protein